METLRAFLHDRLTRDRSTLESLGVLGRSYRCADIEMVFSHGNRIDGPCLYRGENASIHGISGFAFREYRDLPIAF
jgi:hypothetical protein